MTEALVLDLVRRMLWLVIELAGPVIFGGLTLGVLMGILQAATQIQEQSLTFLPKLGLAIGTVVVGGPWALERMVGFARDMIQEIAALGAAGLS